MKTSQLTAIILTYNESLHIERCIRSLKKVTDKIFVIDSFSTDDTVLIAENLGATVKQNYFVNHARQLNWALENCHIETGWTIRLDADEFLSDGLIRELNKELPLIQLPVTGLTMNYRHYFWGRWIKHGTRYPLPLLRIWRTGYGFADHKWMDEKIRLSEGKIRRLKNDFIHEDLNNLSFFINKHNGYATHEAIELLNKKYQFFQNRPDDKAQISAKHFHNRIKERFYSKPYLIWIRSLAYFIYRYFFRLGFLDGKEGLVYHFLQGFWFRFLADMKYIEIEKLAQKKNIPVADAVKLYIGISETKQEKHVKKIHVQRYQYSELNT